MNLRDVHGNAAVDAAIDEAMNQNTGGPIMIHLLSPSEIDALRSRWTPGDLHGWVGGTSPLPGPLPPWIEPSTPVLDRKDGPHVDRRSRSLPRRERGDRRSA